MYRYLNIYHEKRTDEKIICSFLHIIEKFDDTDTGDFMQKSKIREWSLDLLSVLVGSVIYGISVNVFIVSGDLIPGGATGLGIIMNKLTGLSIGLGIILVNLPLFVLSIQRLGHSFLIKTVIATVVSGLAVDLLAFLPTVAEDRILACIFGGLSSGVGLAIIFQRGIMTGGSDLLSHLIRLSNPRWKMGKLLLIVDGLIIAIGTFLVNTDIAGALYSLILVFITSESIDYVLSRTEKGTLCFIISPNSKQIELQILKNLGRGATILYGRGSYSRSDRNIILCAVYVYELTRLRKIVFSCDEKAFFIAANTSEISGYGFLTDR